MSNKPVRDGFLSVLSFLFILAFFGKVLSFLFIEKEPPIPANSSFGNYNYIQNGNNIEKVVDPGAFTITKIDRGSYFVIVPKISSDSAFVEVGTGIFLMLPKESIINSKVFNVRRKHLSFYDFSFPVYDSIRKVHILTEDHYYTTKDVSDGLFRYYFNMYINDFIDRSLVSWREVIIDTLCDKLYANIEYSLRDSLNQPQYIGFSKIIHTGKFDAKETYSMIDIFGKPYEGFETFADEYFKANLWFGR